MLKTALSWWRIDSKNFISRSYSLKVKSSALIMISCIFAMYNMDTIKFGFSSENFTTLIAFVVPDTLSSRHICVCFMSHVMNWSKVELIDWVDSSIRISPLTARLCPVYDEKSEKPSDKMGQTDWKLSICENEIDKYGYRSKIVIELTIFVPVRSTSFIYNSLLWELHCDNWCQTTLPAYTPQNVFTFDVSGCRLK